jgi:hypothetical protein
MLTRWMSRRRWRPFLPTLRNCWPNEVKVGLPNGDGTTSPVALIRFNYEMETYTIEPV